MSAIRISSSPIQPFRKAAANPQSEPTTIAMTVAANATISDVRPP